MLQESKNSGTIYDLTSLRKIRPFSDCKDFKTVGLTKIRFSDCGQSKKSFQTVSKNTIFPRKGSDLFADRRTNKINFHIFEKI